jgi:hypothetical protein
MIRTGASGPEEEEHPATRTDNSTITEKAGNEEQQKLRSLPLE